MATIIYAAVSIPSFTGLKAGASASKPASVHAAAPKLAVKASLKDLGVAVAAAAASGVIASSALALDVTLGSDDGGLGFIPQQNFEVASVPAFAAEVVGGWEPITDLSNPTVTKIATFAVAEHNKKEGDSLELVRVLKGEMQIVAGVNYRLVISAKRGGLLFNYYTEVYAPLGEKPPELIFFVPLLKD